MDFKNIKSKLQGLGNEFNKRLETLGSEVQPEDETNLRETPRNTLINALGLPENWKESLADEKRYFKDLPEIAAGSFMGGVKPINYGKVTMAPVKASKKLGDVKIKPTTQEILEEQLKTGQTKTEIQPNLKQKMYDEGNFGKAKVFDTIEDQMAEKAKIDPGKVDAKYSAEHANKIKSGLGKVLDETGTPRENIFQTEQDLKDMIANRDKFKNLYDKLMGKKK